MAKAKSTKSIKTFEDACKVKGLDPATVLPDLAAYPTDLAKALIAQAKLLIIVSAINGDWKPDWTDYSERKWWPWFSLDGDFRFGAAYYDFTSSTVGSRLCFRTEKEATEAAKNFLDLYHDFMVLSE